MNVLRSVVMAFTMFSRLPMVRVEWQAENMRYTIAALPFVGAVIGLLLAGWSALCACWDCSDILRALGLTLLPVVVSGGIHLDGLADTADALASHATPERKRGILKDPRCGSFAVLALVLYVLSWFALCCELQLGGRTLWLLALIPAYSRCLAALAALLLPVHNTSVLLQTQQSAARRRPAIVILIVLTALCLAGLLLIAPAAGAIIAAVGALTAAISAYTLYRQFSGFSGDLTGCLLQMTELLCLAALVMAEKAVM